MAKATEKKTSAKTSAKISATTKKVAEKKVVVKPKPVETRKYRYEFKDWNEYNKFLGDK